MVELLLANVEYDTVTIPDEEGKLPVKWIHFVAEEDIPNVVRIGKFDTTDKIVLGTHLNAKITCDNKKVYKNVDLLIKSDDIEEIERVEVVNMDNPEITREYDKYYIYNSQAVVFVPPIRFEVCNGRINQVSEVSHYTTAGTEYLTIHFNNRTERMLLESVNALHTERYEQMVDDLLSVHTELVENKESTVSVYGSDIGKSTLPVMKKRVDRITRLIKMMERNPESDLMQKYEKMPVRKIKHMTGRSVAEYEGTNKTRVLGKTYQTHYNIYEHQMIKNHLTRLLNQVHFEKNAEQKKWKSYANRYEVDSLQNELDEVANNTQVLQIDQFINRVESVGEGGTYEDVISHQNLVKVKIPLYYENEHNFQIVGNELVTKSEWENRRVKNISLSRDGSYEEMEQNTSYTFGTIFVAKLSVSTEHIKQAISFAYSFWKLNEILREENRNVAKIEMVGWVKRQTGNGQNQSHGPCCFHMNGNFPEYKFEFMEIESIHLITGNTHRELWEAFREDMITNCLSMVAIDSEAYFRKKSIEKVMSVENRLKDDVQRQTKEWESLEKKLKNLITNRILKQVDCKKGVARQTNIFASNPVYRGIFSQMCSNEKIMPENCMHIKGNISIDKLEHLYEVWCLIKILDILIQEYHFTFKGATEKNSYGRLIQYIQDVLKNGELNETIFSLESNYLDMTLLLEYNVPVRIDRKKLDGCLAFSQNSGRKGNILKPDFVLIFKKRNELNPKVFCMDAKYRDVFSEKRWIEDLCEVALQKYAVELSIGNIRENGRKKYPKIDGSFILSCTENKNDHFYYLGNQAEEQENFFVNPCAYYGYTPRKAIHLYQNMMGNAGKLSEFVLNHWDTDEEYKEKNVRIGSVSFMPENDKNLRTLFAMIFEHYFNIYQTQCFMCGHVLSQDEIVVWHTSSGYEKYYMTCSNCGEFWCENHCSNMECHHDLGKHRIPYYKMKSNNIQNRWKLICPFCNDGESVGG